MRRVPSTDSVDLALHDLGGQGRPLLLTHGNGLCGPMLEPVARRLTGFRSWALDLRGHGASADDNGPADLRPEGFVDDVERGAAAVPVDPAGQSLVAAGHSFGAACLLAVEARRPGTFAGIWAFEPVVFPPVFRDRPGPNPIAERAARRKASFASRDDAFANFASKSPFDRVDDEALRAYVDHGLVDRDNGRVALACRPEIEAAIFESWADNDVYDHLGEVSCPVTVVRGTLHAPGPAAFADEVVERLPHARLEDRPELTHFGPFEDPAGTAESIERALRSLP